VDWPSILDTATLQLCRLNFCPVYASTVFRRLRIFENVQSCWLLSTHKCLHSEYLGEPRHCAVIGCVPVFYFTNQRASVPCQSRQFRLSQAVLEPQKLYRCSVHARHYSTVKNSLAMIIFHM